MSYPAGARARDGKIFIIGDEDGYHNILPGTSA
ncbi:uncharacterized protein G2W53_036901 [Senna tora]|uniref:Uncharacterized protein n=1 Tax=Senna tora TaxID=362788 RepID=A0A834STF6_9FABA|nr:uncharacterized protein G2W53_036901 [Senna tora]